MSPTPRPQATVSVRRATLEDHMRLVRKLRQRGRRTDRLLAQLLPRVVRALAKEFAQQHMILRFTEEDFVYDRESKSYSITADVQRYELGSPPVNLSLLDNGIYAPELTKQINRELSPRSDVYSLAALLYYLISGQDPIPEFSRLADKLPPLRIFEPNLPLGVDPLLRRALQRTPEGRQEDPLQLLAELEQALRRESVRDRVGADLPLEVKFGFSTHTGINKGQKNPTNQDRFFSAYDTELELGLFVVADGVSTCDYGSGDMAADCVIEASKLLWEQLLREPASQGSIRDGAGLSRQLTLALERANETVCRRVSANYPGTLHEGARVMSSTAVALLLNGRQAIVANVGDSRLYLIREGLIDQVTVDMDRRTSLLRQGQGLDAVMNASGLGQLTGTVGRFKLSPSGGEIDPAPTAAEIHTFKLLGGDRMLLCSDGVPDCIGRAPEKRMQQIVLGEPRPAQAAWELVVAANEGGGDDNITAIVIECIGKEEVKWPTS